MPIAALLTLPARAEVEFAPEISAGVSRTDNLTLTTDGAAEGQTVYQITPAFTLTKDTGRVTADIAYRLEGFYYDQRSESEAYSLLDGRAQIALDPENFFIDMGASRNQSIRDPLEPIPQSNLPLSGNRIERDELFLGPSFAYPLGGDVTAQGTLQRSWIQYAEDSQFGLVTGADDDLVQDTFNFSLDNYRRERGFSWAMSYDGQRMDYGLPLPWEYRQATLEIGGWVGSGLRLFTAGGKESAWDQPFDPSLEDTFWEAGIAKSAGDRFSALVAVGERTFGSSRRATLDVAFRRGSTSLSYVEVPTTEGRNPYERGGLLAPEQPDDFLTRPGTAERFISNRLQWSLNTDLRRTDVSLTLFDEAREQRTAFDGTPLPDEEQSGLYVTVVRRLGARTELTFNAERIRRDFSTVDERDIKTLSLAARYTLSARSRLELEYTRSEETSAGGGGGLNYEANLISLLFTRSF